MHRHPERSGLTLGGADFDGLRAPGSVSIELALRVTPARPSQRGRSCPVALPLLPSLTQN